MKRHIVLLLCVSLALSAYIPVSAQDTDGIVKGSVIDEEVISPGALSAERTAVPYTDGYYIVKDESEFMHAAVTVNGFHVENKKGERVSDSYLKIIPLSGRHGVFQYSKPIGMADYSNGVFKIKDDKQTILIEDGTFAASFRCIDAPDTCVIYPIGYTNRYFDLDGRQIPDLGVYLKDCGISLARESWAEDAVKDGMDKDWLPADISFDYDKPITRREFCRLAVAAADYMGKYGGSEPLIGTQYGPLGLASEYTSPYTDVDDYYVSAASVLGIVNGVGGGKFEPDRTITRQEAAVLLSNLAKLCGRDLGREPQKTKFADDGKIAAWANEYVYKICGMISSTGDGVMVGTGSNNFSPEMSYTRQQAIVTIYRLIYL